MIELGKNKKALIILLVAVLAVWGTIAYKIISDLIVTKPTILKKALNKKTPALTEEDNYTLQNLSRDPFLSILEDTATVIEKTTPLAEVVYKPKIQYAPPLFCGTMKGETGIIALIKIKDEYYFLKKGYRDSIIKVIYINDTTVTLLYHDNKLSLSLNKPASNNQPIP